MTRLAAISGLLSAAAASALLAGCAAFNLGPDTDAARAANAAAPGYPRLVDAPEEPADVHCLRAAIGAPTPRTPRSLAGVQGPYSSLMAMARTASQEALGDDDDGEAVAAPVVVRVPCPPPASVESSRLIAERERLEQAARNMRDERPAAPAGDERIVLPADMGEVARAGEGPEARR